MQRQGSLTNDFKYTYILLKNPKALDFKDN